MIKSILSVLLIFCFISTLEAQPKKRDKVKRKYRNVEVVDERLPDVYFSGEVHDAKGKPIPGASVRIQGLRNCVHTNEDGQFLLKKLITQRLRIEVSCIGYKTKTSDFFLQAGPNFHNVALDEEKFHIEPVVVNTQKRLQQIPDIPAAIHSFTFRQMNLANINDIESMSGYFSDFSARRTGSNQTGYTIRGITSSDILPGLNPRIAVLFNDVPVAQQHGTTFELFDMEHVAVINGPQNVLFGTDAMAGAIQYNTLYPSAKTEAYVTAGIGNFGKKEFRGAINYPIIKNKVYVRAAAIYNSGDGYIKNSFGGTLNGHSGMGGRLSFRFLPAYNQRGDLVINYQKDKNPGVAFINPEFPNTNVDTTLFSGTASLNRGKWLGNGKVVLSTTLRYRLYLNENSYFSSISSFDAFDSDSRWDGDGMALETADFADFGRSQQFYQELRFNFSLKSRLNGSIGANYRKVKSNKTYQFGTIEPNIEEMKFQSRFQTCETFLDFTWQLMKRLYVTMGARGVYFMQKLNSDSVYHKPNTEIPENLNQFFTIRGPLQAKNNALYVTWRGGLRYRFSSEIQIFANHSKGMRPKSIQFSDQQNTLISDFEKVMSYDGGYNLVLFSKLNLKTTGFYQKHTGFGYLPPEIEPKDASVTTNLGKSTSIGIETSATAALFKGINLFGNYTWIDAKIDKTNILGQNQVQAGKNTLFTPKHSFSGGLEASYSYKKLFRVYIQPVYMFKSVFLMGYSNPISAEILQPAYGILNINGGFELLKEKIALSFYGSNILEAQYIRDINVISKPAQITTYLPGFPKQFGTKLTWSF